MKIRIRQFRKGELTAIFETTANSFSDANYALYSKCGRSRAYWKNRNTSMSSDYTFKFERVPELSKNAVPYSNATVSDYLDRRVMTF